MSVQQDHIDVTQTQIVIIWSSIKTKQLGTHVIVKKVLRAMVQCAGIEMSAFKEYSLGSYRFSKISAFTRSKQVGQIKRPKMKLSGGRAELACKEYEKHECENTVGSYKCMCKVGWRFQVNFEFQLKTPFGFRV